MAEYNINNKIGVAGIIGLGTVTVQDSLGSDVTGNVFEFGAQGNFYFLGTFAKGLHVGAELIYLKAKMEQNNVRSTGEGLSMGGYLLGYKHTFSFGLALLIQAGYAYTVVSAEAETESESDSDGTFLLNFNVGWTF